ncbi:MAG: DJ-1/PfpI family protein [Bacillota bacterium]|nr:DJ-1/PfpI family protein [Bacillota bacterium]
MKKVLVFITDGTEEVEVFTPVDFLRRAGVHVDLVAGKDSKKVQLSHGVYAGADLAIDEIKDMDYDALYIPGGIPGATNLRDNEKVIDLIKKANDQGKLIAGICAGPIVLEKAGLLKGKDYTCYPGFNEQIQAGNYTNKIVSKDGNILTGKGPAAAAPLSFLLIEELLGKEKADQIKDQTLFSLL